MGIFTTTTIFDEEVDKATDAANTTEDWSLILKICDKVNSESSKQQEFLGLILRKVYQKIPHVSLQALVILDACVNNCGIEFKKLIATADFIDEMRTIVYKSHPKVAEKMKLCIYKWSEEFKEDAQLSRLVSFYHFLRSEGVEFPKPEEPKKTPALSTNPDAVNSQQEADDIAKAIELSLKAEQQTKAYNTNYSSMTTSAGSSLYPSVQSSTKATAPTAKTVKAIYDFEAAEDNELTFKAGDIISILDDSDANWWKGEGSNGSGLFPANFVTSDLSVVPEPDFGISKVSLDEVDDRETTVSFNEDVEVKEVDQAEPVLEINEELMKATLETLQNTDPESTTTDSRELLRDEESCIQMNPLIDQKLEAVDRKHLEFTQLNEKILEALNMYDKLMNESYAFPTVPAYTSIPQMPGQQVPPQQTQMGNYGMYHHQNAPYAIPQAQQNVPVQQTHLPAQPQQMAPPIMMNNQLQNFQMPYNPQQPMGMNQGQGNYLPQQYQVSASQNTAPLM